MAGININKNVLLKGIGKGYFKTVSGKFLEVLSGQNLALNVTTTMTDVYAGDALFPKYTFIANKEGTIEIDVADFSLAQVVVSQTVDLDSTTTKRLQRVILPYSATSLGTSLTGVTEVQCMKADGTTVTVVASAPTAEQVAVTETGDITFGSGLTTGEFIFWFKSDAATATAALFLKDAMPEVASFNWMLITEDEDGNKYQIDIEAKRVRGDGALNITTARDTAAVPKLTVKILDPGDGTDEFCKITYIQLA